MNIKYQDKNFKNLLEKYRFPNGINQAKRTWNETYEIMKKDGVLPDSVKSNTLYKYWSRTKDKKEDPEWIMKFITPILNKIEITENARFKLFWDGLAKTEKIEFFRTIGNILVFNGIERTEIYDEIIKIFTEKGFLDNETITWFLPDEFKKVVELGEDRSYKQIINLELKEMEIHNRLEFQDQWIQFDAEKKTDLFEILANRLMKEGVAVMEISKTISHVLRSLGYLSDYNVRKYIPNRFKNIDMQRRKLGKTFEKSGRKKKGAM